MAPNSNDGPSQPIVFTTQTAYNLPAQKFMIPSAWKRYQLSQLVNKALELIQPIPFDFLINGEILRGTLKEWCDEKGVGSEDTLQLEYIESAMPPQHMTTMPHDDWVSGVSCGIPQHFVTSSYDGTVRVFDSSKKIVYTEHAHTAPATSIYVVSSSADPLPSTYLIASCSQDNTARLASLTLDPVSGATARALASLHHHTAPLSSIVASHTGEHLLTSSWDTTIALWDTVTPETDEVDLDDGDEPERKKRKKDLKAKKDDKTRPKRKAPLSVLKSHTRRVSRVIFGRGKSEDNVAYSCGLDFTIRTWDLELGLCSGTITVSERPFLDLFPSATNGPASQTVLAASADRTVGLYDLRSATTRGASVFVHASLPSCIVGPPIGTTATENQFLTGSYDGSVRVWDLRSSKDALTRFAVESGQKILTIDWGAGGVVGIGGEFGLEVWGMGAGSL